MKKILFFNVLVVFCVLGAFAQDNENELKKEISGRIWYQMYYDTYQVVESRDGILLFYPERADSAKVNEAGKLGSSAFFSRARIKFSGTEAFGAKVSGMVEGDFIGTSQNYVAQLRLRHAFVKLDWERASVLMGQYWHPIVSTDVSPTCQIVANIPFYPLNRSPQVSFTYKLSDKFRVNAAAIVNSYHRSSGDIDMQRNAGIPEFAGKLDYKTDNLVWGINGGIKTLQPRIVTNSGSPTSKKISTPYIGAYSKVSLRPITVRGQLVYGQNLTHFVMLGGMGAKGDTTGVDDYGYSAIKTLTFWGDIQTNGKKIRPGVMFGYTQLLGATDEYYALSDMTRGGDISKLWRIAPRIDFLANRIKLGAEVDYTSAVYAEENGHDSKYKVTSEEEPVVDIRFILTAAYNF